MHTHDALTQRRGGRRKKNYFLFFFVRCWALSAKEFELWLWLFSLLTLPSSFLFFRLTSVWGSEQERNTKNEREKKRKN
jgi:hypothetical protein